MRNLEIALLLDEIGDLLELKGDEGFKTRAYRRAARMLRGLVEPVERLAQEGRLRTLPGIGQALEAKIEEALNTGSLRFLEDLRREVPPGLREVMAVPGVGPRTAILLYRELGVTDLEGLEAAAQAGRLRGLPRLGPRREEAIREGAVRVRARGGRVPLAVARPLALDLARLLRARPEVTRVEPAGGVRRWEEAVDRVVLVAATPDPGAALDSFRALPGFLEPPAASGDRASARSRMGPEVELRVVGEDAFPFALARLTGSEAHWGRLEERARDRGLRLDAEGLFKDAQPLPVRAEEDLYRHLDLPLIPPELREDTGEVAAAAAGNLPCLLDQRDVRGDLHSHSDWSDGVAPLETMAAAARARGYDYLAVTDHSRSLKMCRGLDEGRVRQQMAAIAVLNRDLHPFRLLSGIEVDILADGSLDLPDSLLAELDLVVASVHLRFHLDREAMTGRLLRAIHNPNVDAVGHPTGRLIGERDPYAIDVEAILEACARTGTWLEINAFPLRLDLGDRLAREARDRGVTLVLGTDAHDPASLEDMAWGVATARRGWIRPGDVVNTLPLDRLLDRRGG